MVSRAALVSADPNRYKVVLVPWAKSMSDDDANHHHPASADEWDRITSRDEILRLPHFMVMLAYVSKAHGIPRYGWRDRKLRYHYTDAAGLIGILSSHRLWASDIRFLNDPSEGRFLPERLLALMEGKAGGPSVPERNVIGTIRNSLANPRDNSSTFSVSFCADGDLLSQWRGYGSFGTGYAIGLDLHDVPHPQLGMLLDVSYGEEPLDEIVTDLLDIYVRASEKWGPHICGEAAALLQSLARSFKDPGYKEEQESRIVVGYSKREGYLFQREAPLQFRTAHRGDVIPYIPLALNLMREENVSTPKLPIKRIISGPGVDYERNYGSITRLLEENGYEGVEIVRSAIPFRP
jgi:hypothetical protein